tara:strand:+ start:1416 stop:1772 length:357 start_codon:yes stop_codon:yes gene_type:complete
MNTEGSMNKPLTVLVLLIAMTVPGYVLAQDASYYHCENKALPITIPSMPLGDAVAVFTQATRCPVSLDVKRVGQFDVHDMPTERVEGEMKPQAALEKMLSATPLNSRVIKGGYSIYNE